MTPFNGRAAPSGTKFAYASVETQVLGLVLRAVVGRPVADYLHEKIWEPMGAEADATWLIDRTGQEATYCCLNAVLRDYARLGCCSPTTALARPATHPRTWIEDATRVHPDQAPPARHRAAVLRLRLPGLALAGERRMFALLGVRGQALRRPGQPARHGPHRRPQATRDPAGAEAVALWRSLVRELGN